jgi:hypothetical protein
MSRRQIGRKTAADRYRVAALILAVIPPIR